MSSPLENPFKSVQAPLCHLSITYGLTRRLSPLRTLLANVIFKRTTIKGGRISPEHCDLQQKSVKFDVGLRLEKCLGEDFTVMLKWRRRLSKETTIKRREGSSPRHCDLQQNSCEMPGWVMIGEGSCEQYLGWGEPF